MRFEVGVVPAFQAVSFASFGAFSLAGLLKAQQ